MERPPLKILFVSHDAGRTGAPIGLLAFMNWLRTQTGIQMGTILRSPGALEPSFRALGPTLTLGGTLLARTRLGRRVRRWLPTAWSDERGRLRQMLAEGEYDLIYSSTITNGRILQALASPQTPVLTHVHELEHWIARAGAENLRQMLMRTTRFVAASRAVRDNLVLRHGVPAEKIEVVYEHIRELPALPGAGEKEAARRGLGIPEGAFVVGSCGAEHWRKGRDLIPQLLIALRRQQPARAFHFVWIGRSGSAEEEAALGYDLRQAGLEAYFHSSGEVENPFCLYPALDVFALLSRDDPYPLACLEAAALKTPVVCFESAGGMPEFTSGGCGFAVPYLDLEAMAGALVQLMGDPVEYEAIGERSRLKVVNESTVSATGPQLLAAIEALVSLHASTADAPAR